MKNSYFAVLFATIALLLGGCAGGSQRQVVMVPTQQFAPQQRQVMVPAQQVERVAPQQFNCDGQWQVGRCGSSQGGVQIPVQQIMQAGSGIGNCELVGGAIGAGAGALIGGKDHRLLGGVIGTVAGAFAGNQYCESQQQVQQVVPQQPQNRCSDGKVWAKLAWQGHPQDGNMVCLDQNDPHRADSNNTQPEKVARSESSRCKDGKVWAKLAWPGHPQDGNMVCLLPNDPHKGN